jgi:hypothetical protein
LAYSRSDAYRQQLLAALMEQQAQQDAASQSTGSSGTGTAGALGATALTADQLGLWKDLGDATGLSSIGGSSVATGAGAGATTGAGAMSIQPAMTSATAQSLSTGGSGLMTTAPTVMQSSAYTPAATTSIGANAAGMGALPVAAIVGATALGGKSAYNLFKGKKDNSLGGKVGRATLGIATGGISELARPALMRKSTKEIQSDRWKNSSRSDLADIMKGYDYGTSNADFARTRDEKYLKAEDIRVNPDNYNNVSDWDNWDKHQQDTFLNDLLSNGKVREKKGGIYYDDQYAKDLADKIRAGSYPNQQKSNQQQTRRR